MGNPRGLTGWQCVLPVSSEGRTASYSSPLVGQAQGSGRQVHLVVNRRYVERGIGLVDVKAGLEEWPKREIVDGGSVTVLGVWVLSGRAPRACAFVQRASPGHWCPDKGSAAILYDGFGHRRAADARRLVEPLRLTARPREPPALYERPHDDVPPFGNDRHDDGDGSVPIRHRHRLSALDTREGRAQLVLQLAHPIRVLAIASPRKVATFCRNVATCPGNTEAVAARTLSRPGSSLSPRDSRGCRSPGPDCGGPHGVWHSGGGRNRTPVRNRKARNPE